MEKNWDFKQSISIATNCVDGVFSGNLDLTNILLPISKFRISASSTLTDEKAHIPLIDINSDFILNNGLSGSPLIAQIGSKLLYNGTLVDEYTSIDNGYPYDGLTFNLPRSVYVNSNYSLSFVPHAPISNGTNGTIIILFEYWVDKSI